MQIILICIIYALTGLYFRWSVMEGLSFIAFFGILLINAGSYRAELTMCVMTVFGISAFALVLSDLDHAYHGTFCVDLAVFDDFLLTIDHDYRYLMRKQEAVINDVMGSSVTSSSNGQNNVGMSDNSKKTNSIEIDVDTKL